MARFGNASSSGLLRIASSSAAKIQSYNDAMQAAMWDASDKSQAAYDAYKSYLDNRVAETKTLDPTKALTLDNTTRTVTRSFNSAEIARTTTNIKYGDVSNSDKYATLSRLREQAIANGDYNQAQTLEGEMASTSIAIQNEAIAAQNKSEADSAKAEAALNKGYVQAVGQVENGIKELNAAKLAGEITPANFNKAMAQLYMGNPTTGQPGLINLVQEAAQKTGDPNGTWQNKLNSYANDRSVQSYVNGTGIAKTDLKNNFTQVIVKNADGTYAFKDRPSSELLRDANGKQIGSQLVTDANGNPIKDAAGHAITTAVYGAPQAAKDAQGNVTGFQYAINIDTKGNVAPGTGAGAIRQIDASQINHDDPSGVAYFYNEAGKKVFIGIDPTNNKPIMGNDPSVVTGKLPETPQPKITDVPKAGPGGTFAGTPAAWVAGKAGNLINTLFNRNNAAAQARQDAINLDNAQKQAQARAAADAIAAHNQAVAQAKLLPVFRAPTPAPAPAPTSQYQLPALPAPSPLPGGSGVSTPSSTGNYQKDVLNLGRSLGGLL